MSQITPNNLNTNDRQGNGDKFQLATGLFTQFDAAIFDPDGNTTDSGFPIYSNIAFIFTPQALGQNLTAHALATITVSASILGLNGSDTQHYVRINDGGSSESVLITGGSYVSGIPGGTIQFTPFNNHGSNATFSTASAGVKEASIYTNGQGFIYIPKGIFATQAPIILPTTQSLIGQGSTTTTPSTENTVISPISGVSPCMAVADGSGSASNQGMGIHANYTLYGQGSGIGLNIGGDPNSVFAPASWYGSYTRYHNVVASNFAQGLNFQNGNFVTFYSCAFSGTNRALLIPSTASTGGAGNQPVNFIDCVFTVSSGPSIEMNQSGFQSSPFQFIVGQISGAITGTDIFIDCIGVHFEPNEDNAPLVTVTSGGAILKILKGILSVHGTSLTAAINISGSGEYFITVQDIDLQADVGMTVSEFVSYQTSTGGSLVVEDVRIAPAGNFNKLVNISLGTLSTAVHLIIRNQISPTAANIPAGAALTFPVTNYPIAQPIFVAGGTIGGSGITSVSGLIPLVSGVIVTSSIQTFTAGASIGNTFTTVAMLPYNYYFDGTLFWIN